MPVPDVPELEIDREAVVPCDDPPELCTGKAPVAAAAAVPRPNSATVAAVAALAVRTLDSILFLFEPDTAVRPLAAAGTMVFDTIAAAMAATAPSPTSSSEDPGACAARTSDASRE